MIPTIGQVRPEGLHGVIVECERIGCGNRRKLSFDALGLPDLVVFIEITKHRGFRCHCCGSRKVRIVANHPSPLGRREDEGQGFTRM